MSGNPTGGSTASADTSGMSGLLGAFAGAGKAKQPTTTDILRMGLQMMQRPQQGMAPPMMFGQGGGMGGMQSGPGQGMMGGGMPQGSPFSSQSGPPMTQFPRY